MPAWTWDPTTGQYTSSTGDAAPSALYTSQGLSQGGATSGSTSNSTAADPNAASAKAILADQLAQWGLSALSGKLDGLIKDYGSDNTAAIILNLKDTPEWQNRFSGNAARVKAGLAELSPAEYMATEQSYRQVMQQFGMPASFWDQSSDFATLIGNDMSPDELKTRAQDAQAVWLSTDPNVKQAWTQMYGLSDGAAIASILDPTKALPIVQRMTTASQIGGAALQNGMGLDSTRFEQYADLGVTQSQAQKAFGQMGQDFGTEKQLASRFGTDWSQAQAEQADLGLSGQAAAKQAQMYDAEKALFGARGSADQNTNSTRASGSY
jgi:hypothetical protein